MLNIEIKYTPGLNKNGSEQKVIEILNKYNMSNSIIISSFNHISLAKVKQLEPKFKIGILYTGQLVEPWEYAKKLRAYAIHPSGYDVTADIISECHKYGIKVNLWTLDKEEDIKLAIAANVDGIISNRPDVVKKMLNNEQ